MMTARTLRPNKFKRAIARNERQVGLWLTLETPNSTEIVAGSGFDWLLLDMEHTCVDPSQIAGHLRAAHANDVEVVVRIPWNDPVMIKRLLDGGVRSIMVPFVQNADEARAAVAATRYPPYGIRGVAGNNRANSFNRVADYGQRYAEEQCIIVQVETPAAIAEIDQIGAIDGIDGIFVGPNDLAANMGQFGQISAPDVKAKIVDALARIKRTGKSPGILNFNPPDARAYFEAGFSFIAVGSDVSILARKSESLRAEFT